MRDGCVFCDYDGPSEILATYFSYETFVIEPLNQVTEGHLLVIPRLHVPSFADYETVEQRDALTATMTAACIVARTWRQAGFGVNVISSAGAVATQTVEHAHVHVVPRRAGDGLALPWS